MIVDIYLYDRYEVKGCAGCGNGRVKTYGLVSSLKFTDPSPETISILKAKPLQEVQTTSSDMTNRLLKYEAFVAKDVQLMTLYNEIIMYPNADIKILTDNG